MFTLPLLTALGLSTIPGALALRDEWPQFRGPAHDGKSAEELALRAWSKEGPPCVWRVPTPAGYSSLTVADGRAFTLVQRDEREVCVALDVADGRELWAAPLGKAEYDQGGGAGADDNKGGDGPRSTPSHADGRVYVLDAQLGLHCLDAETGKPVWERDVLAEHEGRLIQWQSAASPLVDSGLVFVAGGGEGQSLLALDAKTGEVRWKALDEKMTHATPIAATIQGKRQVIFFVQSGLIAVVPETGAVLWRTEFPYRTSSAASPVVDGELVYASAGYGVGAAAWAIQPGDALVPELLWRTPNKLMNHWSTPVVRDGHLYGMFSFKEYGEGPLACVALASGEQRWTQPGFGPGNCILVGSLLVALSDAGEIVLVDPDPAGYQELARADVLAGKCWSTPSFADGQLYLRSTVEAVRLDLSGKE